MSRCDDVLGAANIRRVPDAHSGARDELKALGLAKFASYFRAQGAIERGIDIDREFFGTAQGYALREGKAFDIEPLLRASVPIGEGTEMKALESARARAAFAGVARAPTRANEEDMGAITAAIAAVNARKQKENGLSELDVQKEAKEKKRKREKGEKSEKKEKKRRRESAGGTATTSGGPTTSVGGTASDGARAYSQASGETGGTRSKSAGIGE